MFETDGITLPTGICGLGIDKWFRVTRSWGSSMNWRSDPRDPLGRPGRGRAARCLVALFRHR